MFGTRDARQKGKQGSKRIREEGETTRQFLSFFSIYTHTFIQTHTHNNNNTHTHTHTHTHIQAEKPNSVCICLVLLTRTIQLYNYIVLYDRLLSSSSFFLSFSRKHTMMQHASSTIHARTIALFLSSHEITSRMAMSPRAVSSNLLVVRAMLART